MVNRDSDQMRFVQLQYENVKQESARVDEQTTSINQQCKQYQNQMEVWIVSLPEKSQLWFSFSNFVDNLLNWNKKQRTKNQPSTDESLSHILLIIAVVVRLFHHHHYLQ